MELRHLRYFVAAAAEENISRAAAQLHVSQPGVSRQIHDLEDEIGFRLFERGAKSLRLTAAGKVFLTEATFILERAEEAVRKARAVAGGVTGELHVGYAPSLTVRILPQALRTFQAEFPKVRVSLHDLSTEEIVAGLRAGKLHVGLTVRPPTRSSPELEFKLLARYPIAVAVAPKHPLAKLKSVPLARLVGEPLIGYSRSEYPEYHKHLAEIFGRRPPRLAEEHDGVASVIAAVEAGRGIALVPGCVSCMVGPRLKVIPLENAGGRISVGALWDKRSLTPFVERFVAAAEENQAEITSVSRA